MFWRRTIASRDRAESGEPPREDDRIRGFIELDALPIWRAVKPEVLRPVAVRGLRAFEYRRMPSAEGGRRARGSSSGTCSRSCKFLPFLLRSSASCLTDYWSKAIFGPRCRRHEGGGCKSCWKRHSTVRNAVNIVDFWQTAGKPSVTAGILRPSIGSAFVLGSIPGYRVKTGTGRRDEGSEEDCSLAQAARSRANPCGRSAASQTSRAEDHRSS